MVRIDEDNGAAFAFLDKHVESVPGWVPAIAARYEKAWSRRGYGMTYAEKAVKWYRESFPESGECRPKAIDDVLREAVRYEAACLYRFNVETDQPCSQCRYLAKGEGNVFCDRLLIWVAHPKESTCPEFTKEPIDVD